MKSMFFAQMRNNPKEVRIVDKTRTFLVRLVSSLKRIVDHTTICGRRTILKSDNDSLGRPRVALTRGWRRFEKIINA